PLMAGVSPAVIAHAVVRALHMPLHLFNAGLCSPPPVPCVDLGGAPAACLTTGQALSLHTVKHLFAQGLHWGHTLALAASPSYLVLGECVVGGTTTALAVLMGLGVPAHGRVNSSHPHCNHRQKQEVVQQGLAKAGLSVGTRDPIALVAAVGDPMQPVVAGMAIAASQHGGVLLAGGTQMLAVYALAGAIVHTQGLWWQPDQIVVGTTRWVVDDPTGDTVGLAAAISQALPFLPMPTLLATQLSFATSRYPQLRIYEQGFVKEGVGAGGCAIAASLYRHWRSADMVQAIEQVLATMNLQPDPASMRG
ncbi:MAG: TIGR00303 family protein, partial [Cyanobacteria bacterium]|nr:TIGR00303 family protein [Cyanobacteriota bacterium]MDW8202163.1 TIGR00303 family protein [Cyanobacteriota bacterium SKYGB_h_bin112]